MAQRRFQSSDEMQVQLLRTNTKRFYLIIKILSMIYSFNLFFPFTTMTNADINIPIIGFMKYVINDRDQFPSSSLVVLMLYPFLTIICILVLIIATIYGLVSLQHNKNSKFYYISDKYKSITLSIYLSVFGFVFISILWIYEGLIGFRVIKGYNSGLFIFSFLNIFFVAFLLYYRASNSAKFRKLHIDLTLETFNQEKLRLYKILLEVKPNIQVQLTQLANLSKIYGQKISEVIRSILEDDSEIGEYHEMEQVFIRKSETEGIIDDLIEKYSEFQNKKEKFR